MNDKPSAYLLYKVDLSLASLYFISSDKYRDDSTRPAEREWSLAIAGARH
jgi:hypothetical protein